MNNTTVGDHMTANPVTIPADLSLADAALRMHDHGIRHLPVIDQGHVVGIVSERDLALVMGIPGVDKERVEVTEAMTAHPYIVEPSTPLEVVVATLHERKLGTAVVMDKGEILGIFSVIDALAALLIALRGDHAR
ncbi:CBS domain protein [Enhygromyxa salina]|uniref:CBS domain protein n=1 Tax=Enhygromyxa salina TaxID=215803 RepID=A0A0C1ZKQ3_9BACT|nr:CBS domain-containing protein [Enhygromyxa salina]KIG18104.1 CBS domain protein [Enhygromyxa salina]